MPSPILARADALMQRRRQGETGPLDDVPVLTDTVESEDAPPVLLDRVAPAGDHPLGTQLAEQMAEELSARIKVRLLAELPSLIDEVVREFLANQGGHGRTADPG